MKVFVVLAVLVAAAAAFPQFQPQQFQPQPFQQAQNYQSGAESQATIVQNDSDNIGVGNYQARYSTSNNIQAEEAGELRSGPEGPFLAKRGSYSFRGQDGQTYTVTYTADENGFRAEGAHLPKALV